MRAIDTNVLVRLVVGDNLQQVEAADHFIGEGAWVPLVSFVEAVWVLGSIYEFKPKQLAGAIEALLDHAGLVVQDGEILKMALAVFRAKPAIGFSDCVILETARKLGHIPLGTFDRNLAKLKGAEALNALPVL
jgi:predicted nucleic-acid-binding protein